MKGNLFYQVFSMFYEPPVNIMTGLLFLKILPSEESVGKYVQIMQIDSLHVL
jgi:hypothetical protein